MFICIRDHGNAETVVGNVEAGEAGTVYGNGAFFDHQMGKFGWKLKTVFPAAGQFFAFCAKGRGVYMALYNMAIEAAIHYHTSFQVDFGTRLPAAEFGFFQGFFNGGYLVAVECQGFYRKANAVMAHTLVYFQLSRNGRFYPETEVGAVWGDGHYFARIFNDSCKHGCKVISKIEKWMLVSGYQKPVTRNLQPIFGIFKSNPIFAVLKNT